MVRNTNVEFWSWSLSLRRRQVTIFTLLKLNQQALFVSLEVLFNIFVFLQNALFFLQWGAAGG